MCCRTILCSKLTNISNRNRTMSSQSLEVEAAKRKERLALLRQKKGSAVGTQEQRQDDDDDEQPAVKKPTFRSYAPISEDLNNIERKSQATPLDITPEIREHLERTKDTKVADEIDLTTLAPRKVDWDLKRDVQKRLDKLERRTQRAIAELIRELSTRTHAHVTGERLQQDTELLASAVNVNSQAAETAHASDSD